MLFIGTRNPNASRIYHGSSLSASLCYQQPLNRLMHSGCSLILSSSLLGVGVTITIMSLQNFSSTNKVFLIGPILMTVGILGLSRSLMQYFKRLHGRRRRRRSGRERNRGRRSSQPRVTSSQRISRPSTGVCHSAPSQRAESETAIYLGPSDSEDNAYSDDPPPYDAIATTGSLVTSRIQGSNVNRSSLPSLPPYDEGLINPALDISAETFPAPPPYEVVAVQPPSYTVAPPAEDEERQVYGLAYTMRSDRFKSRSISRERGHRVLQVQQLASMLAESLQQPGNVLSENNRNREQSPRRDRSQPEATREQSTHHNVTVRESYDASDHNVTVPQWDMDDHVPGYTATDEETEQRSQCEAELVSRAVYRGLPGTSTCDEQNEYPQPTDCKHGYPGHTEQISITLDIPPGESHSDQVSHLPVHYNDNETESDLESVQVVQVDTLLNNNQLSTDSCENGNTDQMDESQKNPNLTPPIADPLN